MVCCCTLYPWDNLQRRIQTGSITWFRLLIHITLLRPLHFPWNNWMISLITYYVVLLKSHIFYINIINFISIQIWDHPSILILINTNNVSTLIFKEVTLNQSPSSKFMSSLARLKLHTSSFKHFWFSNQFDNFIYWQYWYDEKMHHHWIWFLRKLTVNLSIFQNSILESLKDLPNFIFSMILSTKSTECKGTNVNLSSKLLHKSF